MDGSPERLHLAEASRLLGELAAADAAALSTTADS
jgi:hypothetical protein